MEVNATRSHTALSYPVGSEHAQKQLHMSISGGSLCCLRVVHACTGLRSCSPFDSAHTPVSK